MRERKQVIGWRSERIAKSTTIAQGLLNLLPIYTQRHIDCISSL